MLFTAMRMGHGSSWVAALHEQLHAEMLIFPGVNRHVEAARAWMALTPDLDAKLGVG